MCGEFYSLRQSRPEIAAAILGIDVKTPLKSAPVKVRFLSGLAHYASA
jgi:hypothetical protein